MPVIYQSERAGEWHCALPDGLELVEDLSVGRSLVTNTDVAFGHELFTERPWIGWTLDDKPPNHHG